MMLVVRLLAVVVLLYAVWPLLAKILQLYQARFGSPDILKSLSLKPLRQATQPLSHYEQLVKLLDDDIHLASLLLQKLAYQMPDRSDDWYSRTALTQMQLWIVTRISADRNDPGFGERQVMKYQAKYCDRPSWWVYRKLAVDYQLFQEGFDGTPTQKVYQAYPFTNVGKT